MLPQQVAGRDLRNVVVLGDPLRLGAFTCARWPEKHNGSDSPQNLLRHRTGPKPLLYQSHCQADDPSALLRPVAAAANPSALGSEPVIVPHDQLGFNLI